MRNKTKVKTETKIFFANTTRSYASITQIENSSRSVLWEVALKKFLKLTGKHLCHSLFLNKVTGPRPATSLKKRIWHRFEIFKNTFYNRAPPVAVSVKNTSSSCFCKTILRLHYDLLMQLVLYVGLTIKKLDQTMPKINYILLNEVHSSWLLN